MNQPDIRLLTMRAHADHAKPKNRVFEHIHAREIKKVKEDGSWATPQLETIVHPNEYFKRSYLLKNLGKAAVKGEGEEGAPLVKEEEMEA